MLKLIDPETEEQEATLIDALLAEQKTLTAVERFSQQHEYTSKVIQAPSYQDLIPIRKPSTGEQYSFSVDLDKCTGCKACVVACHSLNGLDKTESWRDIGEIVSLDSADKQTVTSACHHCADPACLNGCPVGAYEKMPDTGVVRHLDDQCIGCQYCSLKCPYDVPKYNKDLGIVRKCDICHERLAEGEAPACVQSCPSGAISIQLIKTEQIHENAKRETSIINGAYRSDYTLPSTVYTSKRKLSDTMTAADEHSIQPSHKHTPLSWMLTLTQLSVGISVADLLARLIAPEWSLALHIPLTILAVIFGLTGLISSTLHLGSPLGSWRVFLGLKTSWLSREIILFGMWMPALLGFTGLTIASQHADKLPTWLPTIENTWIILAGASAVALGLISVFCSIMVYVDTKRAFWTLGKTTSKFTGTLLLGGATAILIASLVFNNETPVTLWVALVLATLWKTSADTISLISAKQTTWSMSKKSALIQLHSLRSTLTLRWIMMAVSILSIILTIYSPLFSVAAILAMLLGEFLQRQIFFQAVVTLKMPGNLER
ncbi:MAG: DmsC/YnfH family molybdoenzyme membrane anchor subunit [Akkermansiaceae bacterium]